MKDKKIYESINHMIKDLGGLDAESWLNDELKYYLSHKRYKIVEPQTMHVPTIVQGLAFNCVNDHRVSPNWTEKRVPILPFEPKKGGIVWQTGADFPCPVCGSKVPVKLPTQKYIGSYKLYGDESFREIDGSRICLYSFLGVSCSREVETELMERFYELKHRYCPDRDPTSWTLHVKDAFNTKTRTALQSPYTESLEPTRNFVQSVVDLIGVYNNSKQLNTYVSYNVGSVDERRVRPDLKIKHEVLGTLLITIIEESSLFGMGTRFFFERTGNDGWINKYVRSLQLTLIWPFITKSLPFQSPQMVTPDEHFLLELADVVCYVLARSFHNERSGSELDFSPSAMGLVRYFENNEKGWRKFYQTNPPFLNN